MLDTGKVFIVDYKLLFDISNVEDLLDLNTTDRREMKASRSPFCVFVSVNGELKPVAIQIDLVSGKFLVNHSFVHPSSPYEKAQARMEGDIRLNE